MNSDGEAQDAGGKIAAVDAVQSLEKYVERFGARRRPG
jgi:hypothetical protein